MEYIFFLFVNFYFLLPLKWQDTLKIAILGTRGGTNNLEGFEQSPEYFQCFMHEKGMSVML